MRATTAINAPECGKSPAPLLCAERRTQMVVRAPQPRDEREPTGVQGPEMVVALVRRLRQHAAAAGRSDGGQHLLPLDLRRVELDAEARTVAQRHPAVRGQRRVFDEMQLL